MSVPDDGQDEGSVREEYKFRGRLGRASAAVSLLALAGCGGGGGGGSSAVIDAVRSSLGLSGVELTDMQAALADTTAFIARISDFSGTRLTTVRNSPPFQANIIPDAGLGQIRPLQASRLDWVRSIDREAAGQVDGQPDNPDGFPDLTGAGVVLGMIDSAVRSTHEQFGPGKFIAGGDGTNDPGDEHGTFVASIMAGDGAGGTAPVMGYAPEARIYAGRISYQPGATLSYSSLAGIMDGARAEGAVAMNNSWSLSTNGGQTATVANTSIAGLGPGFATYLDSLRRFANTGVVVFAQTNQEVGSSSFMAGLPAEDSTLEKGWLAVINLSASYDAATDRITAVRRESAGCQEAARWCLGASGYLYGADVDTDTDYRLGFGSSYATPQVTGALGLLAQAFPTLTPAQLRNRLLATADNSFFTPTHVLEFVPGVEHGYSLEFGHGFLNVRDALMPIGESATATAAGTVVPLAEVSMSGGMLAGDALAVGLSGVNIAFRDQMAGTFAVPMSGFVAEAAPVPMARVALRGWADRARTHAMKAPDGAEVNGLSRIGVAGDDAADWRIEALLDGSGASAGVALVRAWDVGGGSVTAELAAMQGRSGLFGMDFGGDGGARAIAATVGWRQTLGAGAEFGIEAEFGRVDTDAGGLVTGVEGLAYARAGVELAQRSVFQRGDRLSLMVETPVGAVAGAVNMSVASSVPAGGAMAQSASFDEVSVSMVPEAREVDVGFEYGLALSDRSDLVLGYAMRRNAGHVAGRSDRVALLGWRLSF